MNDKLVRHYWLYILRCEQGKYYVGITSKTPEERFREHVMRVRAAYWTLKYKPIEIIWTDDLGFVSGTSARRRENKVTRAVMKERGLNNVRGGDLTEAVEFIVRFGRIYDKEMWNAGMYIILMLLLVGCFYIDKYVYPFIPGGVR